MKKKAPHAKEERFENMRKAGREIHKQLAAKKAKGKKGY